jgi:flagellin-like protein
MSDKHISPVVGVIFMVAITVILAAVVGAFVFGMAGGIKPNAVSPVPNPIHHDLMVWESCEDRIVCFGATAYGVSCFFNETSLLEKYCPEV